MHFLCIGLLSFLLLNALGSITIILLLSNYQYVSTVRVAIFRLMRKECNYNFSKSLHIQVSFRLNIKVSMSIKH